MVSVSTAFDRRHPRRVESGASRGTRLPRVGRSVARTKTTRTKTSARTRSKRWRTKTNTMTPPTRTTTPPDDEVPTKIRTDARIVVLDLARARARLDPRFDPRPDPRLDPRLDPRPDPRPDATRRRSDVHRARVHGGGGSRDGRGISRVFGGYTTRPRRGRNVSLGESVSPGFAMGREDGRARGSRERARGRHPRQDGTHLEAQGCYRRIGERGVTMNGVVDESRRCRRVASV